MDLIVQKALNFVPQIPAANIAVDLDGAIMHSRPKKKRRQRDSRLAAPGGNIMTESYDALQDRNLINKQKFAKKGP